MLTLGARAAPQPHAADSALRASRTGFQSQRNSALSWLQGDRRAERLMRDVMAAISLAAPLDRQGATMSIWIWVAIAGGALCVVGLAIAVLQYFRGWLRLGELLILLIVSISVISIAVVEAMSGRQTRGWSELAVWLLVSTALIINARRRGRQTRDANGPHDEAVQYAAAADDARRRGG